MANPNNPFGFEPISTPGATPRVRYYVKKSGSAIYPGDPVAINSTGDVSVAASGVALIGVAAEYKASSDVTQIAVYDDPDQEYYVQANGSFAAADVFLNSDLNNATSANSTLKKSGMALDSALLASTSTLQFKCLGIHSINENVVGYQPIVRVKLNNSVFRAGVAGV